MENEIENPQAVTEAQSDDEVLTSETNVVTESKNQKVDDNGNIQQESQDSEKNVNTEKKKSKSSRRKKADDATPTSEYNSEEAENVFDEIISTINSVQKRLQNNYNAKKSKIEDEEIKNEYDNNAKAIREHLSEAVNLINQNTAIWKKKEKNDSSKASFCKIVSELKKGGYSYDKAQELLNNVYQDNKNN